MALTKIVLRHARGAILAWVLISTACSLLAFGIFGKVSNRGFVVPGSDSARAATIYKAHAPGHNGADLFAIVSGMPSTANLGLSAPRIVRRALAGQPGVGTVAYEAFADDSTVVVRVLIQRDPAQAERLVPAIRAALQRVPATTAQIRLAGAPAVSERYSTIARNDLALAEKLSFPFVFCVLLVAFQSVVAALLPLLLAGMTLVVTFALLDLIGHQVGLSVFVTNTASILALGLSIDFSLFLVTRFRQELGRTSNVEDALVRTMATTGRAVLLSAVTVAASLAALLIVGVGLFSSMVIGATVAILVAAIAALTLVPALICTLGAGIERLRIERVVRIAARARLWDRIARTITAHPITAVVASLTVLVVLALPATSITLNFHTLRALPSDDPVRQATMQIGAPATIVTRDRDDRVRHLLERDPGVGQIWDPQVGTGGWSTMLVVLTSSTPDGPASRQTVKRLRTTLQSGVPTTYVGGITAGIIDLTERIAQRTPYVIAMASLLGFLILVAGLRSVVIPAKAILCTLLSTGATLGILIRLFGDSSAPQLEFFVPLFLFAILFGLSTDYEIFLLSRVREAFAEGHESRAAVHRGLTESARSITLAGLALVVVFLAFATSSLAPFRQLGIGLAIAVVLDITIVRCVLAPASIVLLGRWNWWFPGSGSASAVDTKVSVVSKPSSS